MPDPFHTAPLVMVHGMIGFRRLYGKEYFAGIPGHLRALGYEIGVPVTHPTSSIEKRTGQLLEFLDAHYPDRRVHLIAHSMGGLDARFLVSPHGLQQGHRVISLTTIATPHGGSVLAQKALNFSIPFFVRRLCRMRACSLELDEESKAFHDAIDEGDYRGVEQLTPKYLHEEFNPNTPDHPDVIYRSYSGKMFGEDGCPLDPLLVVQWCISRVLEGPNDGLVSVAAARWGDWRGILPASHRDQIGHLNPREHIPFDRFAFYERLAKELAELEVNARHGASKPPR